MARVNKYSLADYIITIEAKGSIPGLSIGGPGAAEGNEGSFLGEVKVTRSQDLWTTTGDATGSWVHTKNLDRTGTIEIQINQISDDVLKLTQICNEFEKNQYGSGLYITIKKAGESGNYVECNDCYVQKIPDQTFSSSVGMQTWVFTCGQVTFPVSVAW